jgi:hypothetical protein
LAVLVLLVVLRLTVFRRSRRYGSRHYKGSGGYRGRRRW